MIMNSVSDQEQDARNIRARAAKWVIEGAREDWNEANRAELDAWLGQSPAHMVAYLRAGAAWSRADRLGALRTLAPKEDGHSRPWISGFFGKVLAALAILVASGAGAAFYLFGPHQTIYSTALGAHRSITLADGSQIELDTDTTIKATVTSHEKRISLDKGEAYFQVKHDASRPFIVMAGDHRLIDLGTKFLVRRDANDLRVTVLEGRVKLEAVEGNPQHTVTLTAGDMAIATANSIWTQRESASQLTNELGWRHGMLVFDNTTLADAVTEFNRYNREKLVVVGANAERMTIDGRFRTDDVVSFARAVRALLGLRTEGQGDEMVISR
jgi:transmembrane sensor